MRDLADLAFSLRAMRETRVMSIEEKELLAEANDAVLRLAIARTWGVPDHERICLSCGKTLRPDQGRSGNHCQQDSELGDKFYACISDFTYAEAIEEIKRLRNRPWRAGLEQVNIIKKLIDAGKQALGAWEHNNAIDWDDVSRAVEEGEAHLEKLDQGFGDPAFATQK